MNYWTQLEVLDQRMAYITEKLKTCEDNTTHQVLTDKLYELRNQKKAIQNQRGKEIIKERGLKR